MWGLTVWTSHAKSCLDPSKLLRQKPYKCIFSKCLPLLMSTLCTISNCLCTTFCCSCHTEEKSCTIIIIIIIKHTSRGATTSVESSNDSYIVKTDNTTESNQSQWNQEHVDLWIISLIMLTCLAEYTGQLEWLYSHCKFSDIMVI